MFYVLVLWNFLVPLNKLATVGLVLKILDDRFTLNNACTMEFFHGDFFPWRSVMIVRTAQVHRDSGKRFST
jgi:hypothetical protein